MKAADQVTAFERLKLGASWAAPLAAAVDAVDAERAAAAAVLFATEIKPVGADALSALVYYQQRMSPAGCIEGMASVHLRSLTTWPDLASLCRGIDALDFVGDSAAQLARPGAHETHAAAGARAAAAARAAYAVAIARQLVETGHELAPAARALLDAENLAPRLTAAKLQHEAHAAAELAREEEERCAAAAAAEAHMLELAIAEELAKHEHRDAREDERRRIAAVVTLRVRLRRTKVTTLRIGRHLYAPADLARGVGDYSIERCGSVLEALDHAEAAA